jgi:hypothetical protein
MISGLILAGKNGKSLAIITKQLKPEVETKARSEKPCLHYNR